jgi:isopentenyl phosphate kinase
MTELVFLKLGGSLITDKTQPYTVRLDKLKTLAKEIRSALSSTPNLRLVLGHGSGSFGHYAVKEHLHPHLLPQNSTPFGSASQNLDGGSRPEGVDEGGYWRGFAEVWYRASQLNRYVIEALHEADIPSMAIQPSASIVSKNGMVEKWELSPLESALNAGIVPVIYGDMAFDSIKGGAVLSTETLMFYLARRLKPKRILLAGLEAAVWADFPARQQKVEKVTPSSYKELENKVGGSHGVDVTGGMKSKVEEMLELARQIPNLNVQIFSGEEAGNVKRTLAGELLGTLIVGD